MRIDANMQENRNLVQRFMEAGKETTRENKKDENQSINASQLNLMQDSILERKKKAMGDAMAIVSKQFQADSQIDADLAERRSRIAENKEKAHAALEEVNALSEEQKKLQETWGIAEDSQEQKDLELRIKIKEALKLNAKVKLTKEDIERMQQLGPMTDYQKQAMALENAKGVWQKEIKAAHKVISTETQVIRGIKQELLKHHGMTDAMNAAEASLKASSDEIIGMLMQESMEHVQEEFEEMIEKAEAEKEKKEKQEVLLEEQKAERQETQQQLQETPEIVQVQQEVEQQIQEILEKQKLLEEDLKGIQIDDII